ncbi:hypothetical protein BDW66DRAFT_136862 [Aspergillus desertorum]
MSNHHVCALASIYKSVDIPTLSYPPLPTSESTITSFFLFDKSVSTWKQVLHSRQQSSSLQYTPFAMKLLSISVVLATLLATAVQAAPVAEPQHRMCRYPGQICGKTKRTADALDVVKREADAVPEPFKLNRWCRFPGQICGKVKRAAGALDNVKRSAEAVAEDIAFLDKHTLEYAQLEEELDKHE